MKILILKFNNAIIPILICIFTFFLVIYSSNNLVAAKNGIIIWALSVVPSLFPFFVATELLSYTNIILVFGKILDKIMRPFFNVPGIGSFALIMGIISGSPIGAKIVSNLKEKKLCTNIECERLLAFCNNSSPLFIIGSVGINVFCSQEIGLKLFIVHILSCVIVGFLFRWWKKSNLKFNRFENDSISCKKEQITFYNLGNILSSSIQNAIKSVLLIGGFIVTFSVLISILSSSRIINILCGSINPILNTLSIPISYSESIIIGLIEVTNGLKYIFTNNNTSIIICSFLLGFGGLSILLQVLSITSKAKISIKPYVLGKILHACISAFIMWIWLYGINLFNH